MKCLTASRMVDVFRISVTLELADEWAEGIEVQTGGTASVSTPDALMRVYAADQKATRLLNEQIAKRSIFERAPRSAVTLWWSDTAPPVPDDIWTEQWNGEDTQP